MTRPHRVDAPGMLHHVFNRGLARRTVFENEDDVRAALALFAREVHRGRLRILSYSFLTTHFHALVVSTTGDLSDVMQHVMNVYVRRFNRLRRRDGPLFRSRFGSREVESESYRLTLIRYIDQNAPQARLATSGALYPYGSAAHHLSARRPRWLDSGWVDEMFGSLESESRTQRYLALFGSSLRESEVELVRERMAGPPGFKDELDDLVRAAPEEVQDWMRRKALLADGTLPGAACAGRSIVIREVGTLADERGQWLLPGSGGQKQDAWLVLSIALLRELACIPYREIAALLAIPERRVARLCDFHRRLILKTPEYAQAAAAAVTNCLAGLPTRVSLWKPSVSP